MRHTATQNEDRQEGPVVTPEMQRLIDTPGFLSSSTGGQRLRDLYSQGSLEFNPTSLSDFGQACLIGDFEGIQKAVESGCAPDVCGTETTYKLGYLAIVVLGCQRIGPILDSPSEKHKDQKLDHKKALQYLLSAGAPTEVPDIVGHTVIHHATQSYAVPTLARVLLEAGAKVDHQNKYGITALSSALLTGQTEAIDLLMEFGADVNIKDADGASPASVFFSCGPEATAIVQKWLRRRNGEEGTLQTRECAACGETKRLLSCARCKLVRYCSPDCQKAHWPTHRSKCKKPDVTNTVTVKPTYKSHVTYLSMPELVRKGLDLDSRMPGTKKPPLLTTPSSKLPSASNMIVKIQIDRRDPNEPCLVYDKKRDFNCFINQLENPDAHRRIVQTIQSKGAGGLKAYFRAELKNPDELTIRIGDVLAEQSF